MSLDFFDISRFEFAMSAMLHFVFVPLVIGLATLMAVMQTIALKTQKPLFQNMVVFWGGFYILSLCMTGFSGLFMWLQVSTNWRVYYQHIIDIYGNTPIYFGLFSFILQSTLGLVFLKTFKNMNSFWKTAVIWGLFLGAHGQAIWIAALSGWMQYPLDLVYDPQTAKPIVSSFWTLCLNPITQSKFIHLATSSYVTSSIFVMALGAWYILRKTHQHFARKSFEVAVTFGLVSCLSLIILGDESGYKLTEGQSYKRALFSKPFSPESNPLPDLQEFFTENRTRIANGLRAQDLLNAQEKSPLNLQETQELKTKIKDFGYGSLVQKSAKTTPDQHLTDASQKTVPKVQALALSFKTMVILGVFFTLLFFTGFLCMFLGTLEKAKPYLWICVIALPLPMIANQLGWFLSEYGRQPWMIVGVLPTYLGHTPIPPRIALFSLGAYFSGFLFLIALTAYTFRKFILTGPVLDLGHKKPGRSRTAKATKGV